MEDVSIYHSHPLLYTEERISRYRRGGYHPVLLGDTLENGRYTIYHKLGHGGRSTVWLARDNTCERWVSIKILTAEFSNHTQEAAHIRLLARCAKNHSASKYIVQLLDEFTHAGPNGKHVCLVFELLGPSVANVIKEIDDVGDKLDSETILRMSEQLLESVGFIHQCGLAHGDLSEANVVFNASSLSYASEEEVFECVGRPHVERMVRCDGQPLDDGVPEYIVRTVDWQWFDEDEEDIRILDFGESFLRGKGPTKLAQPWGSEAPETILGDKIDDKVDLWRAGLLIFVFLFGFKPFCVFSHAELVESMVRLVGNLPVEWQEKCLQLGTAPIEELESMHSTSENKLKTLCVNRIRNDDSLWPLLGVLEGLLVMRPSDRASPEQALKLLRNAKSHREMV